MQLRDPLCVMLRPIFVLKRLVAVSALHLKRHELEFLEKVDVLVSLLKLFLLLQQVAALAGNRPIPLKLMVKTLSIAWWSTRFLGDN